MGYVSSKALKHVSVFVVMLLSSFLLSNVMLGLAPASVLQEVSVIVRDLRGLSVGLLPDGFGPASFGFLVSALIALTGGGRQRSSGSSLRA